MAFPDGWAKKWPIDVNADSVISSPVSDWPCLITDTHFPAGAWAEMQATGADLRFSSDADGASELYYDDPHLDVAGEEAHLYVRVPSLASGADTTIYGWVGNASASAPSAASKQLTYHSDILAWLSLQDGSGGTAVDRTAYGNDFSVTDASWATSDEDAFAGMVSIPSGASDALNLSSPSAELAFVGSDQFSLGVVWKRTEWPSGTTGFLLNNRTYNPRNWTMMAAHAWEHRLVAWTKGDAVEVGRVINAVYPTDLHRSVARYDGVSNTWTLNNDGSTTSTGHSIPDGDDLYRSVDHQWGIGSRAGGNGEALVGNIYHAMIWDGVLSDGQVALHNLMLSDPATWASAGELESVAPGNVFTAPITLTGRAESMGVKMTGVPRSAGPGLTGRAESMGVMIDADD